jgi:hypothetical protein
MNCTCGESLDDSITMTAGGDRLKSCPECSRRSGAHQFHPEGHFGTRNMGDGREIVQSWCPECRSNQPARAATATC